LEIVGERVKSKGPLHVIVDHSDALPEAEDLKQRVMASFDCREIIFRILHQPVGFTWGREW